MHLQNTEPKLKHILFISHSSSTYGAETSLLNLIRDMHASGNFEIEVALPGDGPLTKELRALSIKTHRIYCPWWARSNTKLRPLRLLLCLMLECLAQLQLLYVVKKRNIDIIYTNTIVNLSGAIAAWATGTKHIWHIREIMPNNPNLNFLFPLQWALKIVAKFSDRVLTNSKATAEQFECFNLGDKLQVIHNGIDFDRFFSSAEMSEDTQKIITGKWNAAVVCALHERKGVDKAILAVKQALPHIPNLQLLIIGSETQPGCLSALQSLVKDEHLSKHVIFMGFRNNVAKILQASDVFIMPSFYEPFGLSTVEAMSCELPVIATAQGGTAEIVEDEISGFLLPAADPKMIAEKMIYLFNTPDKAATMGKHGQTVAKTKFSLSRCTQTIQEAIEEVYSQ